MFNICVDKFSISSDNCGLLTFVVVVVVVAVVLLDNEDEETVFGLFSSWSFEAELIVELLTLFVLLLLLLVVLVVVLVLLLLLLWLWLWLDINWINVLKSMRSTLIIVWFKNSFSFNCSTACCASLLCLKNI